MTTTGPYRDQPADSGNPHGNSHNAAAQSAVDSAWSLSRLDRVQVIAEVIMLAVCVPLAPVLMVMVAVQGWPSWWLMVAGVLAAWAGDALWTLGEHTVAGVRARRHAARVRRRAGGVGRRGVDPQYWRGNPPGTGGLR